MIVWSLRFGQIPDRLPLQASEERWHVCPNTKKTSVPGLRSLTPHRRQRPGAPPMDAVDGVPPLVALYLPQLQPVHSYALPTSTIPATPQVVLFKHSSVIRTMNDYSCSGNTKHLQKSILIGAWAEQKRSGELRFNAERGNHPLRPSPLTLWRPLLPHGYRYKASYARPG